MDCSGKAVSAALTEDKKLLGEIYLNTELKHSETLMCIIDSLFRNSGRTVDDIDAFAVTSGPGSFTGLRIGIAAVKGLAEAGQKPCIAVSTLKALAYNITAPDVMICPALDARRGQVYTALFDSDGMRRVLPDMAVPAEEICSRLSGYGKSIMLLGDGAGICYNILKNNDIPSVMAPAHLLFQRASSAAMAAADEELIPARLLTPGYLRLSQAERELADKEERSENDSDRK